MNAAVYQFGDIKFSPLTAPTEMSTEIAINYVEKPRLLNKPTLESVGGVLTTIEMDIQLHYSFCNVTQTYDAFRFAMLSKEPKALINGLGFSEGDFVITRIRKDINNVDQKGRPLIVTLNVSFKEYVPDELEDAEEVKARRDAVALISANPITVTPVPKFTTPQSLVMRDVVAGVASAKSATSNAKKAAAVPALAKKYVSEMNRGLESAKRQVTAARSGVDAITGKITNAVQLKDSMTAVIAQVDALMTEGLVPEPNLDNIKNVSNVLDTNVDVLMSASSQLANVITLRK